MRRLATLVALLAASLPAHALEGNGRAGLVWPGAAPMEGAEIAVGAGLAYGMDSPDDVGESLTTGPNAAVTADAIYAPTDTVAIELQGLYAGGMSASTLNARWIAFSGEHFAIAPWVGGLVIGPAENTGWDVVPQPGVAMEFGGERWRGDFSAPLVGVLLRGDETMVLPTVLFGEVGVTWKPADTMSLRVGFGPIQPSLRWRHELGDALFYEVAAVGADGFITQGRVGWRL